VYSNILYFIVVLLIFTGYSQPESAHFSPDANAAGIAVLGILFYLYVRNRFEFFSRRCAQERHAAASRHAALLNSSAMLAIVTYALFIYVFDFKLLLEKVPLISSSIFLTNMLGITPFLILLILVWLCAFPTYRQFCSPGIRAPEYLLSHLKINSTVLLPWLFVSFLLDIVNLVYADFYRTLEQFPVSGVLLCSALLAILAAYLPYLVVRLWDCRPLPPGPLRARLETFCKNARFSYADILLWNLFSGRLITAGVIGFVKNVRYILISPALIQILDDAELESVVAHEIGHVKYRHMFYYILIIAGYAVVSYELFDIMTYRLLSLDIFVTMIAGGAVYANSAVSIALTVMPVLCFILYFRFCFGYFSRNFERQADAYALQLTGTSSGIIQSLEKIARSGSQDRNERNWHHFGIAERVQFLERCERDPALARAHNAKVTRMAAIFAALFIGAGALLYGAGDNVLQSGKMAFVQKVLEKQIEYNPADPRYRFSLGNLYYEQGALKKAEVCYRESLALNPNDPETLNNLAWLYATTKDETLKKPREALELSLQAARLSPQPHILDTLGESYFINGRYEEAMNALELALAAKPENLQYYENQYNKFKKYRDQEEQRNQYRDEEEFDPGAQAI
jgi:Zn-dependent protease with chaperone function